MVLAKRYVGLALVVMLLWTLFPAPTVFATSPLASTQATLQQLTAPTALVNNGVSAYTLNSSRLTWLTNPSCPPAEPHSVPTSIGVQAASDPVLISRVPSYGGASRVLFSKNDPRPAGVCNPYKLRSNIAADADYLYWVAGSQLYRLPVTANPGDEPEIIGGTVYGSASVDVLVMGDQVATLTAFTSSIASLMFVHKTTNAIANVSVAATNARKLGWDGTYYYYLTDSGLRRALPEEATFTLMDSTATNYLVVPSPNFRLFVVRRESSVNKVYIRNVLQNNFQLILSTSRNITDLSSDGTYLFSLEYNSFCSIPQPQCFADTYQHVLFRTKIAFNLFTGYSGETPQQMYMRQGSFVSGAGYTAADTLLTDRTFLYWRDSERILRLPNNAAGIPLVNVRVTGMEVTQGIQNTSNNILLVQNRRTFVRVYVRSDSGNVPGVSAALVGRWNNGTTYGGTLNPVNDIGTRITVPQSPVQTQINDSFLFELPWDWTTKSDLQLQAIINPNGVPIETTTADNWLTSGPFTFRPSPRLQVQFISWGYTINGTTYYPHLARDVVQTYSWIRRTYPLASTPGFWGEPSPGFRPNLWLVGDDQLGSRVDRSNSSCKNNLCAADYSNSKMKAMRTEEGIASDVFMYGMISDRAGWFPRGREGGGGNVSSGPTGTPGSALAQDGGFSPGWWDTDTTYGDWYAGHEIGHSLGRPHPTSGSDDPATTTDAAGNTIVENCGHSRSGDLSYEHGNTNSSRAPIGPADGSVRGFDSGDPEFSITRAVLPSTIWNDMMSYCDNQWISDYTYTRIYNKLMGTNYSSLAVQSNQVTGDWLSIFGVIAEDTQSADIHHLRRLDSVASIPSRVPGGFSLRLYNAGGTQVADYPFTAEVDDEGGSLSFGQVVPFVAGTRQVRIVRLSDGRELTRQQVSAHSPSLSNLRLVNAPSPVTGTVTLAWDASDGDGDSLRFDILYSRDAGASFQPLQLNVTGTSAQIDTARLGGGQALLRVVASDGVLSTRADTPLFTMANKAPAPRIVTPGDGTRIQWGQLLNLSGEAEDFQDGGVASQNLVWSNQYGTLGTGAQITAMSLPAGENIITLTATNSAGISASTSITVFVGDDLELPPPTLNAAPSQVGWQVAPGTSSLQTAEMSVGNSGGGTLSWTASSSASWLTLSANSGSAPATLTLSADPSGIAAGTTARATVTIRYEGDGDNPAQEVTIPVSLTVGSTYHGPTVLERIWRILLPQTVR